MATEMLIQVLVSVPGILADIIPVNEKSTEITQDESDTLPSLILNPDQVGEKFFQ